MVEEEEFEDEPQDGPREGRPPQASAGRRLAQTARERAVEYAKDRAKAAVKRQAKQAAKMAAKRAAQAGAAVISKHPVVLGVLAAVVVLVVLVVVIFVSVRSCGSAGVVNKMDSESGGSLPLGLDYDNESHRQLVEDVVALASGSEPILISDVLDLPAVLNWSEREDSDKFHQLDRRAMETLRYLGGVWSARGQGAIGIRLLKENGPDSTVRMTSANNAEDSSVTEANSAYSFGQAVGIDAIGLTSPELTEAMGLSEPIPVRVDWQLMTNEKFIRPTYEQIEVDAAELFNFVARLFATIGSDFKITEETSEEDEAATISEVYTTTLELLNSLITNLEKLQGVQGLDDRTVELAGRALDSLRANRDTIVMLQEGGDNSDLLAEMWEDVESFYESFRDGIYYCFKAMQVANMVDWRGNANLNLWRAYEARQNIRQLVLDMLRMPVELAADNPATVEAGFDPNLVVKQIIIYSPEDDLDNGLPDLDVFPDGIVAVSEGGIALGPKEEGGQIGDGRNNLFDLHFSSLPIDNGPFSKACTVFVYRTTDAVKAQEYQTLLDSLAPSGPVASMCQALYGDDKLPDQGNEIEGEMEETGETDEEEIEVVGRVSYQKFVHISF